VEEEEERAGVEEGTVEREALGGGVEGEVTEVTREEVGVDVAMRVEAGDQAGVGEGVKKSQVVSWTGARPDVQRLWTRSPELRSLHIVTSECVSATHRRGGMCCSSVSSITGEMSRCC
jgi:hypothetical protein